MGSTVDQSIDNEISDVHAELVRPLTEFDESQDCWEIPLCANSWLVNACEHAVVTSCGLGNWIESDVVIRIFFRVKETVKLQLALRCKVPEGESIIEANVEGVTQTIELQGEDYHAVPVGKFRIFGSGYVKVDLKGVSKTGGYFADVSHLLVARDDLEDDAIHYIKGEDHDETYWHRRGPSLHLKYTIPPRCGLQEYYYNEVTVPKGYDMVGSYFMAIGFDGGYFGIQVNSPDERRVLFSIWSPQATDNPDEITEDNAVLPINKGDDVHVDVFGNEGSGGKSFLLYHWSSGVTYKFLVRGRPDPIMPNYTIFSAWFGERSSPDWRLICEFTRPKTSSYLSSFYSFIENFDQNEGSTCRKCYFNNQWVRDTRGQWYEIIEATVTGDGTAEERVRLDFEGGVAKDDGECRGFYLKHCGFFVGACNLTSVLLRPPVYHPPCTQYRHKKNREEPERNLTVELIDADQSHKRDDKMFNIPLYGNGWIVEDQETHAVITPYGVGNWMVTTTEIHVFFFVRKPVKANLFLRCKVPYGTSQINVDVCGVSQTVIVEGNHYHNVFVGRFRFLGRDYAKVVLKCVMREGDFIADVSHLLIPLDELKDCPITLVEQTSAQQVARTGPSIFLHYTVPDPYLSDEYYYCEVMTCRGDCQPGSKIIAIGFDGGSFGIQDGTKIFLTIIADDGSCNDDTFENDNPCLIHEEEDTNTDYVLKEHHVEVDSTTNLHWAGDQLRCRFLVRGWQDTKVPGYAKYAAWYCAPASIGGAPSWRMVAELRTRCPMRHIGGFYSAVVAGDEEAGRRASRAVFCRQTVRKVDREVYQVVEGEVGLQGGRQDLDAAVVGMGDGIEGLTLREGGLLVGGGHLNGAVLVRKPDDEMPDVDYSEFVGY